MYSVHGLTRVPVHGLRQSMYSGLFRPLLTKVSRWFLGSNLLLLVHSIFEADWIRITQFGLYHPKGLPVVSKHPRIVVVEVLEKTKIESTILKFFEKVPPHCPNRNLWKPESHSRCDPRLFDQNKTEPLFIDQKLC